MTMIYQELDDHTRGRIDGLLEAAALLIAKKEYHEERYAETDGDGTRNPNRRHHNACRNTCENMAMKMQKEAIEIAMNAAEAQD